MEISDTSSTHGNKFIIPKLRSSGSNEENVGERPKMKISIDPDFADEEIDNENKCDEFDGPKPAKIGGTNQNQKLGSKKSKDRELKEGNERNVKMSIGNWDEQEDYEDDEIEETPIEKQKRVAQEMRKFREKDNLEDFDFPEIENSNVLRAFIQNQVMFSNENSLGLDDDSSKKKGPKIIEGYLWGAVIGNGSYGKVKEVIDTFTLARRAVKIMKYDKIKKIQNGWSNIKSEMRILNTLKNRNIIKMIEVFDIPDKKKIYMIFEYCIGSVQQLLDIEPAKRLTIGESHMIFCEMIRGLDYLHARRISHKDIKPGNLLISIDFVIKICDFGVAEEISIFQNDGKCTKVNGTPKFQPPECVAGNHEFFDGFKADLWSAGITLYNMVSGKYPFEEQNLLKLYESIAQDPLVMPTNVELSNNLQDLIKKLLEKNFEKRLGTHETMLHSWFITSFPEDQGLGKVMERMKTGNRPLTMKRSMQYLYDDENDAETDQDGSSQFLVPVLTEGGAFDREVFSGYNYLLPNPGELSGEDGELLDEVTRRPSSRSMPTSPPQVIITAPSSSTLEKKSERSKKRNLFSCIFRNRSDSS